MSHSELRNKIVCYLMSPKSGAKRLSSQGIGSSLVSLVMVFTLYNLSLSDLSFICWVPKNPGIHSAYTIYQRTNSIENQGLRVIQNVVFEKVQIHSFTKVKNCDEQHNLISSLFNNSAYWIIACCCLLLFDYSS